jgi:hypothetical protein
VVKKMAHSLYIPVNFKGLISDYHATLPQLFAIKVSGVELLARKTTIITSLEPFRF